MSAIPSVALDASLWDEPTTGIALYTRCLAQALEAEGTRVFRVGARHGGDRPRKVDSRSLYFLGPVTRDLAKTPVPLFHAVSNFNLPLRRVAGKRFVLTVHDLIPLLFPQTVSTSFRWQFQLWLGRSLQVADHVLCVSECTRRDLLARFEVDPARVSVVHNGVDHVDKVEPPTLEEERVISGFGLPSRFVLYAGALEARKNVEAVVEACALLRAEGKPITLALLGQPWFGVKRIEAALEGHRRAGLDLRALGYQPERIFYALLRRAAVLAFPSRYEGFGLPPLEAMRLGTPAIVSEQGALPEVCGDGALQVAPDDVHGLARAIDDVLHTPGRRAQLAAAGQAWAAGFTWRRAARQTLEGYARALECAGDRGSGPRV